MSEPASSLSTATVRLNRLKLMVLWLVPFGLMGIAGIVYYLVQTGQLTLASKNHGELIRPPLQLQERLASLRIYDGQGGFQPDTGSPWQHKWTLVVPALAGCDERCREALYLTRQLHIRLDKDANRVQRALLASPAASGQLSSDAFNHYVEEEHRLLRRLLVSSDEAQAVKTMLTAADGEVARFFVVDPQGWAMMAYFDAHEGNATLADLKHLLKFSRER